MAKWTSSTTEMATTRSTKNPNDVQMETKDRLSGLPSEVKVMVLDLLDVADLVNVSSISRQLKQLVEANEARLVRKITKQHRERIVDQAAKLNFKDDDLLSALIKLDQIDGVFSDNRLSTWSNLLVFGELYAQSNTQCQTWSVPSRDLTDAISRVAEDMWRIQKLWTKPDTIVTFGAEWRLRMSMRNEGIDIPREEVDNMLCRLSELPLRSPSRETEASPGMMPIYLMRCAPLACISTECAFGFDGANHGRIFAGVRLRGRAEVIMATKSSWTALSALQKAALHEDMVLGYRD